VLLIAHRGELGVEAFYPDSRWQTDQEPGKDFKPINQGRYSCMLIVFDDRQKDYLKRKENPPMAVG